MLPLQFFSQNIHFALSLFAALVFFAVFWLYFDAWAARKEKSLKELCKWLGFLLVSISFVFYATLIEQSVLGKSIFGNTSELAANILRLVGYIIIILGQVLDPLQPVPEVKGIEEEFGLGAESDTKSSPAVATASSSIFGLVYALPVAAIAVAALYWRRATTGLERHLKPVALGFTLLFCFELTSLASLLRGTDNPTLYNLVRSFGPFWMLSHIFLLAGVIVLGAWVWHYLTERFFSQLFMIFTASILIIFLITTVTFTFLLMRNVQNDALDNLHTAVNVLDYALDSKKAETKANAEVVSQNPAIAQAIGTKDHKALTTLTSSFLKDKKQSSLVITDSSGQVLLRAEDPDRWGDSISSDTLVRRAVIGDTTSTITTKDDVLAPLVYIKTTVPVRATDNSIVGTASVSLVADNALVDGIKNSTGLDSAVYSDKTLSATTFMGPDGKSRLNGVKVSSAGVTNTVLKKGKTFKGQLNILNRQYLAVYTPLKDADNVVVGMLFIGQPQANILQTAGRSISLTFLLSAFMLVLSCIPVYLVTKNLVKQL
jgi:hypothetical protein